MGRSGANRKMSDMPLGDVMAAALSQSMNLVQADHAALKRIPYTSRSYRRETLILPAGAAPVDLHVVLDGIAERVVTSPAGERQIVGFLLPGDFFDWPLFRLNSRLAPAERVALDHSVVALAGCSIGVVRHQVLRKTLDDFPPLAEAFERRALRELAISRECIVNMAGRRATVRLGHLLCELYTRLAAMRMVHGESCHLPLTQVHLAEALGLSAVHVNRGLQTLRSEQLLSWNGGVLSLPDLRRLQRESDFTGAYLEIGKARRWALVAE
jgi:CRP-like cAMP-binding protein